MQSLESITDFQFPQSPNNSSSVNGLYGWLFECHGAWESTSGKEMAWNILSLFTTSGMLFLEVSLVAFLLQGNYASGLDALTRTFVVSGLIVGLDLLLKEEDLHLENVYYSEMQDAGFIDGDWE